MLTEDVNKKLKDFEDRKSVVIYGMETHVCIRQTAFDLLDLDYDVTLVTDTVSSMSQHDRNCGMASMQQAGVNLVTF